MAGKNLGKAFEERVKKDWLRCFPDTLCYRLPDQQSGYAGGGGSNPCDFFCFTGNVLQARQHGGKIVIKRFDKRLGIHRIAATPNDGMDVIHAA